MCDAFFGHVHKVAIGTCSSPLPTTGQRRVSRVTPWCVTITILLCTIVLWWSVVGDDGGWLCGGCVRQVLLCLYMIVGTVLVYNERGYALICNPFDAQDTKMAFMLWVFYMSKILDFCDTCACPHTHPLNAYLKPANGSCADVVLVLASCTASLTWCTAVW